MTIRLGIMTYCWQIGASSAEIADTKVNSLEVVAMKETRDALLGRFQAFQLEHRMLNTGQNLQWSANLICYCRFILP